MKRRPAAVLVVVALVVATGATASDAARAMASCRRAHTDQCVGVDLSHEDLRRWHLRGVDLRGANLSRADLRGVDLRNARLDRANLTRADLRNADVRDAAFATAALAEADLRRARLDRARFSAARLGAVDLRGADFGMSFWSDADLTGARTDAGDSSVPMAGRCDTTLPSGAVAACAFALGDGAPAVARRVRARPTVAVALTRLAIRLVQRDRLNPPVGSRVYAYTGLALAETTQPNSIALNALAPIPAPGVAVDWRVVAASGAPLVPRALTQVVSTKNAYAALRDELLAVAARRIDATTFASSVEYGRGIASRLVAWSGTDGFATTRDRTYTPPSGPGRWVPTPTTYQGAQEPYWGTLRPYTARPATACVAGPPPEFSTEPGSTYMEQARGVYDTSRNLTRRQKAIARFWADDRGRTGTPTGHWVATTNIAIARRHLDLGDAARLHGLVGAAAGDAFIATWATKFRYNQIRPVTTIRQLIDPQWAPYLNTPPFPDWVSGHATVSGATSAVLSGIIGTMRYQDPGFSTGADVRSVFAVTPRTYPSFRAAAREAAKSREYAGIHYASSDAEGMRVGTCLGNAALAARR